MLNWLNGVLFRLQWALGALLVIAFFWPWVKEVPRPERSVNSEGTVMELVSEADRPIWESLLVMREQEWEAAWVRPFAGHSGWNLLWATRDESMAGQREARRLLAFLGDTEPMWAAVWVYAIPATALLAACFVTAMPRAALALTFPLLLTLVVYMKVRLSLNATYFERVVMDSSAGIGLWLSLYGLLAVALCLLLKVALSRLR